MLIAIRKRTIGRRSPPLEESEGEDVDGLTQDEDLIDEDGDVGVAMDFDDTEGPDNEEIGAEFDDLDASLDEGVPPKVVDVP